LEISVEPPPIIRREGGPHKQGCAAERAWRADVALPCPPKPLAAILVAYRVAGFSIPPTAETSDNHFLGASRWVCGGLVRIIPGPVVKL
jgi:hypothetical protein